MSLLQDCHIIFFCLVTCVTCTLKTDIEIHKNFNELKNLTSAMVDRIIRTCAFDTVSHIALLKDSDTYLSVFHELSKISVPMQIDSISADFGILNINSTFTKYLYIPKFDLFIVFASSVSNFKSFLKKLKKSMWWNLDAIYLIVDTNTLNSSCNNAHDFLWQSWESELVSSTFFCFDYFGGLEIYTYNPFIDRAPDPWSKVSTHTGVDHVHPWTLLKQHYNDETTCKDLTFDKFTNLGGYVIRGLAISAPPTLIIHHSSKGHEIKGLDGEIIKSLLKALNGTLALTVIADNAENYGNVESNGYMHGFLANVTSGAHDMLLNMLFVFDKWHLPMTYTHINSGISALTRYAGYETEGTKILKFMNKSLIFLIFLICAITVIILGVFAGQGISSAFLEIVRLVTGTSMMHLPRRNPTRIYVITVVFLFLITGSTFQSNLSSIITSPMPKRNVDGRGDLKASGFTIYAFHSYRRAIFDTVLLSRLKPVNHWDCSKYVLENENVACASERGRLLRIAYEKNLHISKHRVTNLYCAYVVRPNWPLLDKVNAMLKRLVEGGLVDLWASRVLSVYIRKWKVKESEMHKRKFRPMTLHDLMFSFYILAFGISCSIVIFATEFYINRFKLTHNCSFLWTRQKLRNFKCKV